MATILCAMIYTDIHCAMQITEAHINTVGEKKPVLKYTSASHFLTKRREEP